MEPTTETLILPKPYLSWSAFSCWLQNPERFKREYFANGKRLDSKFLQFGKGIAGLVEKLCELQKELGTKELALKKLIEIEHLDDITISVLTKLDTDGVAEFQMNTTISNVPLLSYMDLYNEEKFVFREYKTGTIRNPWNPAKVYKHGQLVFYAVALRSLTGKMPEYCHLDWIITDDSPKTGSVFDRCGKGLRLTGNIKSFKRVFDKRELDRMEEDIVRVANEISEAYKEYINQI